MSNTNLNIELAKITGKRLSHLMIVNSVSDRDLGKVLGYESGTVNALRNGIYVPASTTMYQIAKQLPSALHEYNEIVKAIINFSE